MFLKLKIWLLLTLYKSLMGYSQISTKLLFAQIIHETGNFTSSVFKENKNLFGMRQAKIRKNTAQGTNRNHAIYKSHRKSIIDYFLRQSNFKIPNTTDTQFIDATVKSGYAEDKEYLQKWINTYKNVKKPFAVTLIAYGGLFFLLVYVFYVIYKGEKNKR